MASSYHIATLGVRLCSIKAEADNISQLITANQIEKKHRKNVRKNNKDENETNTAWSNAAVDWLVRWYGGMYLPPYFFLPQHVIFSKIIVLWQVCHNTLV